MSDLANPLAGQKAPGGVGRVPNLPLAQVDTPAAPRPPQTIEDIIGEAPQQGQSIEDILGPPPDVQRQQTVEAGGLPPSGLHWDEYVKQAPMGRVLDAFGHGAAQGWGTGDLGWSDEVTSALRKAGIYPDAESGQSGLVKAFNEAILRPIAGPLATAAEAAVRATGALFGGYQAATEQIGEEIGAHPSIPLGLGNFPQMGRELAAMPEAFFGMPNSLRTPTLPEARSLNVIGSGEGAYFGTAEPKPIPETVTADAVRQMQDAAANKPGEVPYGHAPGALGPAQEAAPPGGYSPSQIPPADIHEAARRVAPLAFADYDNLGATRDALRAQIVDAQAGLRRQAEAQAPGATEIADLRDRLQDTTPRLAKKYEARLADLLPAHDEFLRDEFTMAALTRDTPEIAALRQDLQRTDYQMRDLAPQVTAAYREVAPQFAAPEAPAVAAPSPALAAAEAAPPETAPEVPQAVVAPAAPEPVPTPVAAAQPAVAPTAEPVAPGAPRVVPDIATDVAQKLVAAGRPEEEANAAAQLVAAHYDARAQRFQGALGTAQELYAAEAPEIRAGRERAREMAQPGGRELEQSAPVFPFKITAPSEDVPETISANFKYGRDIGPATVPLNQLKGGVSLSNPTERARVGSLKEAIQSEGGHVSRLIADTNGNIIEGQHRLEALREIGTENAPVHFIHDLAGDVDEGALERAVDVAQKMHSDQRTQLIEHILNAIYDENGSISAVREEYEPPLGYTQAWNGALDYLASHPVRELEQQARGKIRLDDGRATITLMKNANASTFIHETGHAWLEELLRDATDERAPADLIGDAKTVRDWLGAKEDEAITTAQHEKFARGFERYMMEGVAPSRALDSVFAKFRDWLTKIYQTVSRLRAPVSDDIRDVFDRLLSTNPEPTTVAPEAPEVFRGEPEPAPMPAERPTIRTVEGIVAQDGVSAARAKRIQEREIVARAEWRPPTAPSVESSAKVAADLADIHEEDAAHTEPERAAEVADTIKAETDETIKTHAPEVANELLGQRPTDETGRGATEATGAPGAGAGTGGGAAEEPVPEPRPISGSGGQAAGEGARGAGTTAEPGSPTEPFRPTESELVDKAGNIRLDNLNQPEDVNQAIREAAAENDDFIHARRGVISDSQVLELADALGMKASDLDRRKLGEAFNAEQVMAARRLLITSATNVRDAMAKAAEGTDADVLAYGEAKSRHRMIQEQVSGITAEAGRALRAFRSIGGAEGADAEFIGNFLRDATGRTLFQLRLEARKGAALETAQQVSKFLNDVDKPGLFDWIQSVFINALLSGPFTHAGYTAAGEMFGLFRAVGETGISAGVGAVRRAFGLGEEEYAHIGEVPAQLYGMYRGARNGSKAAWQALKSGQTVLPEEVTGNLALSKGRAVTSLNVIPNPTIGGARIPIGNVLESPSRLVAALHSFNWTTFYSQSISGQAFRTAMEERLQGQAFADRVAELTTSPTPQMIEIGSDDAYNAALMKRPSYDSMMGSISRLTNWGVKVPDIPLPGGNTFPMGTLRPLKYIDPFVQIQSNVIKTAFGRGTPLALFSPEVRADLSMRNGGVAFDRTAGRILAGTGFMVAAGSLAAEGLLNHSAPSDPNQSRAWQRINGLPHGLTIGGTSYDMLRLGNLGLQMSVAADLYHVSTMISTEDASKVAAELVHAFSQNILDESFMRGPAAIMQAAEDENRYGAAWVRNFVSSTVPFSVGMAQVAREIDPYSRQARTTMDAILAKIPVASEQLQPRYDVWGQPVTNRSWDLTYNEAIKNDPTDRVLYGLGIYPSLAPRTIRGVRLSDAQYSDFARTSGRLAKMRLDAMVNTAGFAAIPKGEQVKVINGIIESSRETARATVMMQSYGTPNDIVKQAANNKLRQLHEGKVGAQ